MLSIGVIGLGKMGFNIALNMKDHNISVIGYNRSKEKVEKFIEAGGKGAFSIKELVDQLDEKKVVWLMVPAGKTVDLVINKLLPHLNKGDIIIDAGNSNYNDTLRRFEMLETKNIEFIDVGTSGGTYGARNGACMMVGGKKEVVSQLEDIFISLCTKDGYSHVGKNAAGHYVKMVHNGIEYAMMQAIGEGFDILYKSQFELDYEKVAKVWSNGSIISGYLMEMTENAFKNNSNNLEEISPEIDSSGEGLWTAMESLKLKVPAAVISQALYNRFKSKDNNSFSDRLIAAQRNEFGGHKLHKK